MTTPELDSNRAPLAERENFYCPHPACGVFAHQFWGHVIFGSSVYQDWRSARCGSCGQVSLWLNDTMVYPRTAIGVGPNPDMPADVVEIYEEARAVAPLSPRAAAGLLRLGLQVLIDDLEPGSGTINAKIGTLVKKGLHPIVQQSMDYVRVVGNEAVHPGQIDVDGDPTIVTTLFELLNIVVEQMISREKHLAGLIGTLPQQAQDGITQRDTPKN